MVEDIEGREEMARCETCSRFHVRMQMRNRLEQISKTFTSEGGFARSTKRERGEGGRGKYEGYDYESLEETRMDFWESIQG